MSNVLASGVSGAFCCSGGRKHALKLTRITRFGRLELELFFCNFGKQSESLAYRWVLEQGRGQS